MSLMQQLLEQHDADVQARILQIVNHLNLDENDPVFLLMLSISTVQALVEVAPNELKQTYQYCHQQLLSDLDKYEKAASRGVEAKIAQMAEEIVRKAGASKSLVTLKSVVLAALASSLVLGLGILSGAALSERKYQADPAGRRLLTTEQIDALEWAMSKPGRYARQFLHWNDSVLNGECRAQVKGLNVTLQYGSRIAIDGFCFVWVVSPEKRRFAK
jgi:hypothetical protein